MPSCGMGGKVVLGNGGVVRTSWKLWKHVREDVVGKCLDILAAACQSDRILAACRHFLFGAEHRMLPATEQRRKRLWSSWQSLHPVITVAVDLRVNQQ
jgi:hypothetical protein